LFLIAFDLNYAVTEQDGFDEEHSTSLKALYYEEHIKFILRICSKHGKGMANNKLLQPQLDSRAVILRENLFVFIQRIINSPIA
jgi:hypothetical protein